MESDLTGREANKRLLDMFAGGFLTWFTISCSHLNRDKPGNTEMHWAIPVLGMLGMLYFIGSTLMQLKKGMRMKDMYINLISMLFLGCMFVYILIPLSSQYNLVTFALLMNTILLVTAFFVLFFHLIKRSRMPKEI